MDYPFLSKFWMFIAKKYSIFNEFIFFSEYSVHLSVMYFEIIKHVAVFKGNDINLTEVHVMNIVNAITKEHYERPK